jgi:hypothetical protein
MMIVSYCISLKPLHLNIVFEITISMGILEDIYTEIKLYNTNLTVIYLGSCFLAWHSCVTVVFSIIVFKLMTIFTP